MLKRGKSEQCPSQQLLCNTLWQKYCKNTVTFLFTIRWTVLTTRIKYSTLISGTQPALHFGVAIFIKFHSMTSSCFFNRGTTSSQTVTYNNNVFLPAGTKSIVQTHTFSTALVNKNTNFYNRVGGWITRAKWNFWLHAICACTEQHSTC